MSYNIGGAAIGKKYGSQKNTPFCPPELYALGVPPM